MLIYIGYFYDAKSGPGKFISLHVGDGKYEFNVGECIKDDNFEN